MEQKREGFFGRVVRGVSQVSEALAVNDFRKNSTNFREMCMAGSSLSDEKAKKLLKSLNESVSFSQMLATMKDFTAPFEREPAVNQMLMKSVVFFASYVNSDACFAYYVFPFKKELMEYMIANDYSLENTAPINH